MKIRDLAGGVLAQVIGRDGQELSATATRLRNLSNADHLALLQAIWASQVTPLREQHYRELLDAVLPSQYRNQDGYKNRWLWRTLRTAELAGLDAQEIIRDAISQRSLSDARDIAAVIDARIRQQTAALLPRPARPWSEQVPVTADTARQRYLAELAAAMDDRADRIGQHAADHALPWAVGALGPVPGDPPGRRDWQQRARAIGVYRELNGWDHPSEPIGPEPAGADPDTRAAWHAAYAALGPGTGRDVRGLPDGMLWHLRDTFPIETAWAPRWTGDQLRHVRRGADDARLTAIRARAEARAALVRGQADLAERHQRLADSYQAMENAYQKRADVFAATMDDRVAWERLTADGRSLAVAADSELRRRHPGQHIEPLRSAEPEPVSETETSQLTIDPGQAIPPMSQRVKDLAAVSRRFSQQMQQRQSRQNDPQENLGPGVLGRPLLKSDAPQLTGILQPPRPLIPPSTRVLKRARVLEPDREAAK